MRVPGQRRAIESLVREWFTCNGADPGLFDVVSRDVTSRLACLPSPLRLPVAIAGTVLAALPTALAERLYAAPGASEYARLVRSLTAVSYFDRVTQRLEALTPQQRKRSTEELPVAESV